MAKFLLLTLILTGSLYANGQMTGLDLSQMNRLEVNATEDGGIIRSSLSWRFRFLLPTTQEITIAHNANVPKGKYVAINKAGDRYQFDTTEFLQTTMQKYNPIEISEAQKSGLLTIVKNAGEALQNKLKINDSTNNKLIIVGATWCSVCKPTLANILKALKTNNPENLPVFYLEFSESDLKELPVIAEMGKQRAVDFNKDYGIPFVVIEKNGKYLKQEQTNSYLLDLSRTKIESTAANNNDQDLKSLVAQVIMTSVLADENDFGIRTLTKYPVAGYLIYKGDSDKRTAPELKKHFEKLKSKKDTSGLPPLIAVDQEGGESVQRIVAPDICKLPRPERLEKRSEKEIRKFAEILTRDLIRSGVNMNFAPVVDLKNKNNRDITGWGRALSENVDEVIRISKIWNSVMRENGLLTIVKHLPGIGDSVDTHNKSADISKTIEDLKSKELKPFVELANSPQGITGMMVGHIRMPLLDDKTILPYSAKALKALVSDGLNFNGLIINDAFHMGAATKYEAEDMGAYKAILSGVAPVYVDVRYLEPSLTYIVNRLQNPANKSEANMFMKVLERSIQRVRWAREQIGKIKPTIDITNGCNEADKQFLKSLEN